MDNPILVFVNLNDFPEIGDARLDLIAWNTSGDRLDAVEPTCSISVLVLNDAAATPEDLTFANADSSAPLLIVWHKGSGHHSISQIQADETIKGWGTPRECAMFSHNDGSDTWTVVKQLIVGELTAIEFAKRQRAQFDLQQLEIWATVCQIGIIEPGLDTSSQELAMAVQNTLRLLPNEIRREGEKQWDEPPADWSALLKQVRDYATALAREQLTE